MALRRLDGYRTWSRSGTAFPAAAGPVELNARAKATGLAPVWDSHWQPKTWQVLDGTRQMSFEIPLVPDIADVFLPDGTLMYGVADRFEFFVTRNGRDTVRIFGRSDQKPIPIPAGFADTTIAQLTNAHPLLKSVAHLSDPPTNYPMWNSATVDDHGFVWVSLGLGGRTPNSVGIFSPDGRYLGMAPLWWHRVDQMSFGAGRTAYVGYDKDRRPVIRV